jgi:hypothetical protein
MHKLRLLVVQEINWIEGSRQPAGNYTCFFANENSKNNKGTGTFIYSGIISAVKRVKFINESIS